MYVHIHYKDLGVGTMYVLHVTCGARNMFTILWGMYKNVILTHTHLLCNIHTLLNPAVSNNIPRQRILCSY